MSETWVWILFNAFIVILLYLDLVVFHKKDHEIPVKEALIWSVIWIVIALLFNWGVYLVSGRTHALNFFTGYVLERSLSMDNLFVFLLIFNYFKVPAKYHHKILFWGILGAVVTRAAFIFAGVALIERFHWVLYIMGAILVWSGFKLFGGKDEEMEPEKNPVLKLARKIFRVIPSYDSGKFFVKENKILYATGLFIVLVVIESTDVVFAVDSIPAILAITRDPFIVYSSNIFAILGLRALYFALAGLMRIFYYLNYGLGVILIFIGAKMLLESKIHISTGVTLIFLITVLTVSILASMLFPKKESHPET